MTTDQPRRDCINSETAAPLKKNKLPSGQVKQCKVSLCK